MQLLIVTFVVLAIIHLLFNQYGSSRRAAHLALGICAVYVVLFLFVPPTRGMSSKIYLGRGYGILPMLPLCTILFPNLIPEMSERTNQIIGWFAFIGSIFILLLFKYWIWQG
ncbi:hypothetical protein OAP63_15755 [Vibrio sp.]|nr:hypothetical protein [Vibrio sp.]